MKKKLIIITMSVMLLFLSLPATNAIMQISTKPSLNLQETFTGCYIEASGAIDFTWQLMDIPIPILGRFILYWPVVFLEPDTKVTIYSEKNGDILWQDTINSGQWTLHLVGFKGMYNNDGSTDDTLIANLEGKASFIMISTEKNDVKYNVKNERSKDTEIFDNYNDCYIEMSGLLSDEDYSKLFNMGNFWKIMFLRLEGNGEPPSFVLYWYMRLDETSKITVRTEENGEILFEHDGTYEQEIRILRFDGDYISSRTDEGRIHKDISGHVQKIWLKDLP